VLALAAQQRFESTKIQVVGITTVCGTYGAENATQNITRLLKTMKNDKVRDSFVSFYFGFLLSVVSTQYYIFLGFLRYQFIREWIRLWLGNRR
jgi:hypothetical protein